MNSKEKLFFLYSAVLIVSQAIAIKKLVGEKSYAASTETLKSLLDIEEALEENLEGYVNELKEKLAVIQEALRLFINELKVMRKAVKSHLSNPFSTFALVRHQQQDWRKWTSFISSKIGKESIAYAREMRHDLPTALDLEEASRSIELLIRYYGLNPLELANGTILEHSEPESSLSAQDCFALGIHNFREKSYSKAEFWFKISLSKFDEEQINKYYVNNFSRRKIHKWLGFVLVKRQELALGIKFLQQANAFNYDHKLIAVAATRKFCSASFYRPTHLHCRYNNWTTPFLRIAPLKMEELSLDPLTLLYHNAIYNSEIEAFFKKHLNFTPALINMQRLSSERTAKKFDIHATEDSLVKTINRRVEDMSGFHLDNAESLSLVNYGIGGHFDLHKDAHAHRTSRPHNRIATVLFYLGDVEQGGATIFPELNLSVPPEKGSALFWHNLQPCGSDHPKTLHAACPVIVGSKYVLTKWINSVDQMFIKPCQANHTKS